jgi:hypothetical protein
MGEEIGLGTKFVPPKEEKKYSTNYIKIKLK